MTLAAKYTEHVYMCIGFSKTKRTQKTVSWTEKFEKFKLKIKRNED